VLTAVAAFIVSLVTGLAQSWFQIDKVVDNFASGPPVQILSVNDWAEHGWTAEAVLSASDLAAVPDGPHDRNDWYHTNHAMPLQKEVINLVLEGRRANPVTITDLYAHIVACKTSSPLGTLIYLPLEGDSESPDLALDLDAGDGRATARTTGTSGVKADPYFNQHSISLIRGERISITLTATSLHRACTWQLAADEIVDGKPTTQIFDPQFAVSGSLGTSRYTSLLTYAYMARHSAQSGTVTARTGYAQLSYSEFCAVFKSGLPAHRCETLN